MSVVRFLGRGYLTPNYAFIALSRKVFVGVHSTCINTLFAGPAGDGGVRRGERPIVASRSGMARMFPSRRAWQKEAGR